MRGSFLVAAALLSAVMIPAAAMAGTDLEQVAAEVDSLESVLESLRGDVERIQAHLDSLQAVAADSTDAELEEVASAESSTAEEQAEEESEAAVEPEPVELSG